MISVTRTRLDNGIPAVAQTTADALRIAIDDRHITAAGAVALECVLNGLAPQRRSPGADAEGGE
ncbi:hypothetical protein ACH4UT_23950 [Streptomyces sp. NPDC020799]|uniref:hypothetical protein n=1 Tax=Streptomyces sp. NPDC020799 TaxID=3365091 RepID=UPI0037B4B9AC